MELPFEPMSFDMGDVRLRLTEGVDKFRGTVSRSTLDYRHFILNRVTTDVNQLSQLGDDFDWPAETSPTTMIKFLGHVGMLGLDSTAETISKYIRTVEQLNSNDNGSFLYNIYTLFIPLKEPL